MAGKSVSFNTSCNLYESQLEAVAKWLSCNGEVWGIGPTLVFTSAAALFLYHELEGVLLVPGDQPAVGALERSLITSMVVGMLALMVHLWVCAMRFFQYYLDTVIKDSPNVLLEMTTAGILGSQTEMMPLGPLTRFLRAQQPQIHITICWFLSLCYADYVRKHYCRRFNFPYLEQWQIEMHARACRGVRQTIKRVNSFVSCIQQRLRGFAHTVHQQTSDFHTVVHQRIKHVRGQRWVSPAAREYLAAVLAHLPPPPCRSSCATASWDSPAKLQRMPSRPLGSLSRLTNVPAVVHRTPARLHLATTVTTPNRPEDINPEDYPWRNVALLPLEL